MKTKPEAAPVATAYTVTQLDLSETVIARKEAFRELDAALTAVRRARQGFDDLQTKSDELSRRAEAIEIEISQAGGTEIAARALGVAAGVMGIDRDAPAPQPVDVASLEKELETTRTELRETLAAVAAAPALWPQLIERLDTARHAASASHQTVRQTAAAWSKQARDVADKILTDERFLTDYLVSHQRAGLAVPADFSSLDPNELQRIASERTLIDAAKTEGRPLVAESKITLVNDNPDWPARMSAINAENERRWKAERAEREAREAREAQELEQKRREAKRMVAAGQAG